MDAAEPSASARRPASTSGNGSDAFGRPKSISTGKNGSEFPPSVHSRKATYLVRSRRSRISGGFSIVAWKLFDGHLSERRQIPLGIADQLITSDVRAQE